MLRNVLIAGLLGGLAMMFWLFVSNAVLPLKSNLIHQVAPDQLTLHTALKQSITDPGCYAVPYLSHEEEHLLDDYREQPVYSIVYTGYSHGASAGGGMLLPFVVVFAVGLLAAWLTAQLTPTVLASYWRKVLFVMGIGLAIVLSDDILQLSFGPQPREYLLFLAVNNLITWTVGGLVIARWIRPVNNVPGRQG